MRYLTLSELIYINGVLHASEALMTGKQKVRENQVDVPALVSWFTLEDMPARSQMSSETPGHSPTSVQAPAVSADSAPIYGLNLNIVE
jgi:hypothetical protein